MLTIDEDGIRALCHMATDPVEVLRRVRQEIQSEFLLRTRLAAPAGRLVPPLELEEALTPGLFRQPGGLKWATGPGRRGAP